MKSHLIVHLGLFLLLGIGLYCNNLVIEYVIYINDYVSIRILHCHTYKHIAGASVLLEDLMFALITVYV